MEVGLKRLGFYLFGGFSVATFAGGVISNRSFKLGLVEVWPKDFAYIDFSVSGLEKEEVT